MNEMDQCSFVWRFKRDVIRDFVLSWIDKFSLHQQVKLTWSFSLNDTMAGWVVIIDWRLFALIKDKSLSNDLSATV